MSAIQLRRRTAIVLASFIAAVVVMVVAPFVHPVAYERVCSANGNKLVAIGGHAVVDDGSGPSHDDHAAHCPLCMPAGVPSSLATWNASPVPPLAHVQRSIPAARLASLVGAPLPARGPPLRS